MFFILSLNHRKIEPAMSLLILPQIFALCEVSDSVCPLKDFHPALKAGPSDGWVCLSRSSMFVCISYWGERFNIPIKTFHGAKNEKDLDKSWMIRVIAGQSYETRGEPSRDEKSSSYLGSGGARLRLVWFPPPGCAVRALICLWSQFSTFWKLFSLVSQKKISMYV